MTPSSRRLRDALARRTLTVGVFEADGEPADVTWADAIPGARVGRYACGPGPSADRLAILPRPFGPTEGPVGCERADVFVVPSGVTVTPTGVVDVTPIRALARALAPWLGRGQLVVLTGAFPPGTARGVVAAEWAACGVAVGADALLASAPPAPCGGRVVGGWDEPSRDLAADLLYAAGVSARRVASLEGAEVAGLLAGAYGATRAAFANEVAALCRALGTDFGEALAACGGGPEFSPPPGARAAVSLLAWGARRAGAAVQLLPAVDRVTAAAPRGMLAAVTDALNGMGKSLRGSRILITGGAPDAAGGSGPDPVAELRSLLVQRGAVVAFASPPTVAEPETAPVGAADLEVHLSRDAVVIEARPPMGDREPLVPHERG